MRALIRRGAPGQSQQASSPRETGTLQPALFVIWYALAETLREWGIKPALMLGYSLGEYVAACLSGVLSFDDALRLVTYRAELISGAAPGAMAAIALGEEATRAAIAEAGLPLDIAGVNAPAITVVACRRRGRPAVPRDVRLGRADPAADTAHAFHSRMLNGLADDLTAWVRDHVTTHEPAIPYLSNVTGAIITAAEATDPGYWARHMCSTVRFTDAAAVMLGRGDMALLEVGPGSSLGGMVRRIPAVPGPLAIDHRHTPGFGRSASGGCGPRRGSRAAMAQWRAGGLRLVPPASRQQACSGAALPVQPRAALDRTRSTRDRGPRDGGTRDRRRRGDRDRARAGYPARSRQPARGP